MTTVKLSENGSPKSLRRAEENTKKMAEFLGIPSSVLSQILSGQRELGMEHAYVLAEYMGLMSLERDYFITPCAN